MSSKIKVDTIENVAGSGNVSLGSGHNLVVPGNITGQGTATITSNATVGGTFGVTGASTLTGDTQVTGNLGVGVAPERKFHVEGSGAEFSLVDTSRPTDKKTINMFIDANGKGNIRMMNDAQSAGNAAIVIEGSSPHTAPLVTKPYQCYFSVGVPGNQNNISNSGYDQIQFNSETFDIGNNFASNTFTAPVTGKYLFSLNMRLDNIDTSATYYNIGFNTSNRSHYQLFAPRFSSDPQYWNFMKAVIVDMDANDTATISIFQNGGTSQTDINSSTRWYGYLLG